MHTPPSDLSPMGFVKATSTVADSISLKLRILGQHILYDLLIDLVHLNSHFTQWGMILLYAVLSYLSDRAASNLKLHKTRKTIKYGLTLKITIPIIMISKAERKIGAVEQRAVLWTMTVSLDQAWLTKSYGWADMSVLISVYFVGMRCEKCVHCQSKRKQ